MGRVCEPAVMVKAAKSNDPSGSDPASDDPYGRREGEVAVALPPHFDASLYFIGRIHTPWKRREECPKNAREFGCGLHHRA